MKTRVCLKYFAHGCSKQKYTLRESSQKVYLIPYVTYHLVSLDSK